MWEGMLALPFFISIMLAAFAALVAEEVAAEEVVVAERTSRPTKYEARWGRTE